MCVKRVCALYNSIEIDDSCAKNLHWPHMKRNWTVLVSLSLLGTLGGVVIFVAIGLPLAEMLVRVSSSRVEAKRADRNFWKFDSQLGWYHNPNVHADFSHPEFDVKVRTNGLGLRDENIDPHDQRQKVLFLGDSLTWGFGVEEEERFTERLQESLPGIRVVNAGVSGYGTDQELLLYEKLQGVIAPDIVAVLVFKNDFQNIDSVQQYGYPKPAFCQSEGGRLQLINSPVPEPNILYTLRRWVLQQSYLLKKLPFVVSTLETLTEWFGSGSREELCGTHDDSRKKLMPLLLSKLIRACKKRGQRLLLVGYATAEQTVQLSRLAQKRAVPFVDLTLLLKDKEDIHIPHDEHWNGKGHWLVAEALKTPLKGLVE